MNFSTIADDRFHALKQSIESYPRLAGYYIINMISIRHLRENGYTQEAILDAVIYYFDDDPQKSYPSYRYYEEVPYHEAKIGIIKDLVGGNSIGHTVETMSPEVAEQYFDAFVDLFDTDRRYYVGLDIHNDEYVFWYGILVVDSDKAGILWIVESD